MAIILNAVRCPLCDAYLVSDKSTGTGTLYSTIKYRLDLNGQGICEYCHVAIGPDAIRDKLIAEIDARQASKLLEVK